MPVAYSLAKGCATMQVKIKTILCVLFIVVLLFPIPMRMKDGGTVTYQALLYSISDVHRLAPSKTGGYEDGIIIRILGMQIINTVG